MFEQEPYGIVGARSKKTVASLSPERRDEVEALMQEEDQLGIFVIPPGYLVRDPPTDFQPQLAA